jgi:hypothetical protein
MLSLVVAGSAGFVLIGLGSALVKRLGPKVEGSEMPASPQVEQLEARIAELEHVASRVMELEERVDFAERMLAQHRAPGRIGD